VTRIALLLTVLIALAGCEREMRKLSKEPVGTEPNATAGTAAHQPGASGPGTVETAAMRTYDGDNAYELSQGKRLFRWFNCNGCHSAGGGGMGPALMDEKWIYGHEPEQVYATIMVGRPNGMPSFRGRVSQEQAWQLVAYVRSMSGLAPKASAPGRSDALAIGEPESRRPRLEPRSAPVPAFDR